ncbi:phage tail protein [Pseudomonas sp. SG20052]|uniref:phage tail protein n=1 Tax=Pseudomonas sp. SG20052 TaxID=3074147 RepID=UPI00287F9AE6|nr:phage tail protein [Pseudomonas sp. SG20052]WNF52986.1 phage tail protein [Pseudomonas sp. SG20052]
MIDANSQFFAILTNVGMAKQANADALGIPWKLTEMGVGDANLTDPIPSATQTQLIREWRRRPLNQLKIDPVNPAVMIAEQVIPADEGGFWIREIGLYDADGDLVAVANCAPSFKPVLSQGSGRTQVVRMNFIVSSSANITLKIDPSVVLATREYVDTRLLEELNKLDSKQSVRVATTANIALAGLQIIDGIALVAGDRVLVKNQSVARDNGLYVVAAGVWGRALDADSSAEVTSALLVSVEQGSTLADTRWQLVTDGAIVLGATALTFQNITQGFAAINAPALISPTANTPAQFDNSKLLANTEFVKRMGVEYSSFTSIGVNTSLSAVHVGGLHSFSNTALLFANLPPTTGVAQGATICLVCASSAGLNIQPAAGDALYTSIGSVGSIVLGAADTAEFIRIDTQWRLVGGSAALKYSAVMLGANWLTQSQFDSSKSFATTEFVQRALGNLSGVADVGNGIFANAGHVGKNLNIGAGNSSLPPTTSVIDGATLHYKNTGVGSHTLSRVGADVISCDGSPLTTIVIGTGEELTLVKVSSNWIGSGTAALKYTAAFMASLLSSGYQKLPSGLILQWGYSASTTTSVAATFPVAFPNRCAWIGSQDNGGAPNLSMWSFNISGPTSFTCHNIGALNKGSSAFLASVNSACAWFAVGY